MNLFVGFVQIVVEPFTTYWG